MKMGFLFGSLFWGILILLIGISIIVRVVFNINIPIIRIVFGLILIYWGFKVISGGFRVKKACKSDVVFDEAVTKVKEPAKNYNTVFGKNTIDITDIKLGNKSIKIDVNTVFGACVLRIDPKKQIIIKVNAIFAEARMPDSQSVSFGKNIYKNKLFKKDKPAIIIDANVVFGEFVVVEIE